MQSIPEVELSDVLQEVMVERARQDEKWREQNHEPAVYLAILAEEVGEVAQEVLRAKFGGKSLDSYRAELIQVAAVAVAMVECLDRDKWTY
jgi:NTP pyrophosphatase (non-canonical NTP hydrolase)